MNAFDVVFAPDPITAAIGWAHKVYHDLERGSRGEANVWKLEIEPIESTESTSGVRIKKAVYRRETGEQQALNRIDIALFEDGRIQAVLSCHEELSPDFGMKLLDAGLDFVLDQVGFPSLIPIHAQVS